MRLASRIIPFPYMYKEIKDWFVPILAGFAVQSFEGRLDSIRRNIKLFEQGKLPDFVTRESLEDHLVQTTRGLKKAKDLRPVKPMRRRIESFDLNLKGWRHQRDIEKHLLEGNPSTISRFLTKKLSVTVTRSSGQGSYRSGSIMLWVPPTTLSSPEDLYDFLDKHLGVLRHEMVHYTQDVIEAAEESVALREERNPARTVGTPSKGNRRVKSEGLPIHEHALADVEFYTRLEDMLFSASKELRNVKPQYRREWLDLYSGISKKASQGYLDAHRKAPRPDPFLRSLYQDDKAKWRKAVSELVRELL